MYGKRLYGRRVLKDVPQKLIQDSTQPTFQCTKCGTVKTQNIGFTDLSVVQEGKVKILGRICNPCVILLETWVKG